MSAINEMNAFWTNPVTKITREEAIAFFTKQLKTGTKAGHIKPDGYSKSIGEWHYGKCELYDLIDAIYGVEKDE